MIHDFKLFISLDLNADVIEWIETANDKQIKTRETKTIRFKMIVADKNINVTMLNVYYCLELDSNLISLDVLKAKKFDFRDRNDWLSVIDKDDDVILQAKRQNNVYFLLQSRHFSCSNSLNKALIVKNASLNVWHQRVYHMNVKDLITLSKMTKKIEFVKQKDDKKNHFCETCVLDKAHKIHSKTSAAHRVKLSNKRLHSDLFDDDETLSDVEEYRYEIIIMNDHIRMKFVIILRSKNEIILKIQALFNKMKTHTDRKIRFFRIDDERKFVSLKEILNDKNIEWEKSASFVQDQDEVSKRAIRTIIEKARILLITANLSKRLWSKALFIVCYLSNKFFIKTLDEKTFYETWYDEKSDLSNLRVYDCKAYVIDYHAKKKNKMTQRTWIDILINYEIKNQWRIYDEKSVFIRRDVIFNEVKMTYKSFVEKSKLLLNSLYLRYEDDDPFQSIKDEDDQLVKIDQSVRERDQNLEEENSEDENSDLENSEDSKHQEENLIETISSAESFTEMQSVRENLISSSADSSQSVRVNQAASSHAAEKTLVVSANQDDDDQFILADDSNSDDQIDDQSDNRFISEKNNSLILNYSRSKIKHDYKQFHHKSFVKSAKIESMRAVDHDLVILKTFEQTINDPQTKE